MLKITKLGFVFNHGAEKKISEVDCFGLIEEAMAKIDLEKSEQMIQKVLVTNSQAENHSSILAYLARHIECLSEKKILGNCPEVFSPPSSLGYVLGFLENV